MVAVGPDAVAGAQCGDRSGRARGIDSHSLSGLQLDLTSVDATTAYIQLYIGWNSLPYYGMLHSLFGNSVDQASDQRK